MKKFLFCLFVITFLFTNQAFSQSKKNSQKPVSTSFTIDRECDGGNCHFEIISFNYQRNSSIAVGIGDAGLSYYFSVQITKGNISKEYIYHDEPNIHFIEKDESLLNDSGCFCTHIESGEKKVGEDLNKLLLDVYNLGKYIVDKDLDTRKKKYSEINKFAVLTNLRKFSDKLN